MSKSLKNAYLYITGRDFKMIGEKLFRYEDTEDALVEFCNDICVSDYLYNQLINGPCSEDEVLRALLYLSLVALKSDPVKNKIRNGFSITIRGTDNPMDIHEPRYIFADGTPLFQVYQDFDEDCRWKILFMHPQACFDDDLLYATLQACE